MNYAIRGYIPPAHTSIPSSSIQHTRITHARIVHPASTHSNARTRAHIRRRARWQREKRLRRVQTRQRENDDQPQPHSGVPDAVGVNTDNVDHLAARVDLPGTAGEGQPFLVHDGDKRTPRAHLDLLQPEAGVLLRQTLEHLGCDEGEDKELPLPRVPLVHGREN